jgi:hypothetical protein
VVGFDVGRDGQRRLGMVARAPAGMDGPGAAGARRRSGH